MPHTIALAVQDHPGVLHRTVSLLRRRGYNIRSLAVGHSERPGVSRMTLVVEAEQVEQVTRQLDRLVEVLAVRDVTSEPTVERETALLDLTAPAAAHAAVTAIVGRYAARVVAHDATSLVVEATDAPARVEELIAELRPFGIREMVRTGRIALASRTGVAAAPRAAVLPWLPQADGSSTTPHAF